jgi:hypothetical protein
MVDNAWKKTPNGTDRTYNYNSSDDPDNKPTTGIPTSYSDILKGIGAFFGLGLDPKDLKNIDKIELGQKRIEDATNAINEVNKTIIINGVLIIVTEGIGYAFEEIGGAIVLRILSKSELAAKWAGSLKVPINRVYGEGAYMYGKSFSLINPQYVPFYRNFAGLPNLNSGQYLLKGSIPLRDLKVGRWLAAPLDGNTGGLPFELYQNYNQLLNPVNIILKKPF